ncbi:hypothetical protein B0H11DRAFT_1927590 [Mycena galericulata]|nr:hypothetical protein B0H11DRAFT_1927590 [Mycena galericulata]
MKRLKLGRPKTVAHGMRGAYVGTLSHNPQGYPELQLLMDNAETAARTKRNSTRLYFVAFGDRTAQYLPREMHADVQIYASVQPDTLLGATRCVKAVQVSLNFQLAHWQSTGTALNS